MLHEFLDDRVTIDNRAIGGRTARRFIDEGYLDAIDADITAGDTLLVQFGTNDGNKTATYTLNGETIPYYLEPSTDFKRYLNQYIDVALAHDATLVLVTPPPRNSAYCTGGNGTGAHAEAMRELAVERGVALSDLNEKSVTYLTAICPAPATEDFFLLRADGTVDGTHFQENGARILASLVVDGIVEAGVPLASAVK
jgi:lysophospholipase L1-like esterase